MTSGTRTRGSLQFVQTGAGSNAPLFTGYVTKTWSGTDYPPATQKFLEKPTPFAGARRIEAFNGLEKITVEIPQRLPPISVSKPPRRARIEEHPYSMSMEEKSNYIYRKIASNELPYGITVVPEQDGASPQFDYGWTSNHENQLIGRLRNAVAGSSFNAGAFLGEGREALSMIANAATRLYGAYSAFKRGQVGSASRILTTGSNRNKIVSRATPASNWLELQYGWLPLLSDAHDGAVFLAHHLNVPLQHVVRVSARSKGIVGLQNSFAYPGGYTKSEAYQSVRLKAILKEKDVYKLAGLMDPLSVAWELVPYSFVIDWFLPIGDYLQNRGLASALTGTFVRSQYRVGSATGLYLSPFFRYGDWGPNPDKVRYKVVSVDRTVSSALSIPLPEVVPLSQALSWRRAANAVALLSQLVK